MAKAPGFIFYPGDYLQDTQNLSAAPQAAYDRIMCLHMKYTSISKSQLDFFTKRCTPDEKVELLHVLKQDSSGFYIEWVVDSILKYRSFCESRSNNRKGKKKEQVKNTSNSSEKLVEIENESENEDDNNTDRGVGKVVQLIPPGDWEQAKTSFFSAGGWMYKFSTQKKVALAQLEDLMREFIGDIELKSDYKPVNELQRHFTNWYNSEKKKDGKRAQTYQRSGQSRSPKDADASEIGRTGAKDF